MSVRRAVNDIHPAPQKFHNGVTCITQSIRNRAAAADDG